MRKLTGRAGHERALVRLGTEERDLYLERFDLTRLSEQERVHLAARVEAIRSLVSPHLPRYVNIAVSDSEIALTSLAVTGDFLADLAAAELRACSRYLALPVELRIVLDLLSALSTMHARGVVHGALAPTCLLIGVDGHARVTGLLRQPSAPVPAAYAAPEILLGDGTADHRADLYSLAVLLWEALEGAALFPQQDRREILARQLAGPLPKPQIREPWAEPLADLVAKGLSVNPADRPASASDFASAIRLVAQARLAATTRVGRMVEALAEEALAMRRLGQAGGIATPSGLHRAISPRSIRAAKPADAAGGSRGSAPDGKERAPSVPGEDEITVTVTTTGALGSPPVPAPVAPVIAAPQRTAKPEPVAVVAKAADPGAEGVVTAVMKVPPAELFAKAPESAAGNAQKGAEAAVAKAAAPIPAPPKSDRGLPTGPKSERDLGAVPPVPKSDRNVALAKTGPKSDPSLPKGAATATPHPLPKPAPAAPAATVPKPAPSEPTAVAPKPVTTAAHVPKAAPSEPTVAPKPTSEPRPVPKAAPSEPTAPGGKTMSELAAALRQPATPKPPVADSAEPGAAAPVTPVAPPVPPFEDDVVTSVAPVGVLTASTPPPGPGAAGLEVDVDMVSEPPPPMPQPSAATAAAAPAVPPLPKPVLEIVPTPTPEPVAARAAAPAALVTAAPERPGSVPEAEVASRRQRRGAVWVAAALLLLCLGVGGLVAVRGSSRDRVPRAETRESVAPVTTSVAAPTVSATAAPTEPALASTPDESPAPVASTAATATTTAPIAVAAPRAPTATPVRATGAPLPKPLVAPPAKPPPAKVAAPVDAPRPAPPPKRPPPRKGGAYEPEGI